MTATLTKTARGAMVLGVLGAPFAVLALSGCPKKDSGASDAATSASASATAPATTTAATADPTPIDAGKHTTIVLPKMDGGLVIGDAAIAMPDAMPTPGDAATPPATTDAGGTTTATMPPECDQYFAKNEACIAKMPATAQGPARAAMGAQKGAWSTQLASGRDQVIAQCKAALAGVAANPLCK